jgi:hypothetical protein
MRLLPILTAAICVSACSLLVSYDQVYQGPSADASTPLDASQGEAAAVGASPCAAAHTFCADFEGPDSFVGWSYVRPDPRAAFPSVGRSDLASGGNAITVRGVVGQPSVNVDVYKERGGNQATFQFETKVLAAPPYDVTLVRFGLSRFKLTPDPDIERYITLRVSSALDLLVQDNQSGSGVEDAKVKLVVNEWYRFRAAFDGANRTMSLSVTSLSGKLNEQKVDRTLGSSWGKFNFVNLLLGILGEGNPKDYGVLYDNAFFDVL